MITLLWLMRHMILIPHGFYLTYYTKV